MTYATYSDLPISIRQMPIPDAIRWIEDDIDYFCDEIRNFQRYQADMSAQIGELQYTVDDLWAQHYVLTQQVAA